MNMFYRTGGYMKIRRSIIVGIIGFTAILAGLYWYHTLPKHATITATISSPARVGEKVVVPIFIDTAADTINAAEVYLKFNPRALTVDSIMKEPSFFQLWIKDQPAFSNDSGTISLAGGLPTPGFKGRGQIGAVVFIPKVTGQHLLTFDPKTRILKNDGQGTFVPLRLAPIIITVR